MVTMANSSGKNYQNRLMKVKVIARQNSDIFETQRIFSEIEYARHVGLYARTLLVGVCRVDPHYGRPMK